MVISIDDLLKEKAKRENDEKKALQDDIEQKRQAELAFQQVCAKRVELLSQIPELAKKIGKPIIQKDLYNGKRMGKWTTRKIQVWDVGYASWYESDKDGDPIFEESDWQIAYRNKVHSDLKIKKNDTSISSTSIPDPFRGSTVYMDAKGNCYLQCSIYHYHSKPQNPFKALFPISKSDVVKIMPMLTEDNVKEMLLNK